MDSSILPPIPPTIVQLTGPLVLGIAFNWALFGALTVQVYLYYLAFPEDRYFPTKALVTFTYVFEVVQTVLITRDIFREFGFGFGNMIILNEVGILWFSVPCMDGIMSAIVQVFYAWRIWLLSRQPFIPIFVASLAVVQGGAGIWSGVHAHTIGLFSEVQIRNGTPTIVWLVGTAVCDTIIAASMIYYLSTSRTGFRATHVMLVKLIRITIETGFVTAALAILDLVLFLTFKSANYHLTPSISLSKLYANTLLVLLNARLRIVNGRDIGGPVSTDETLSFLPPSTGRGTVIGSTMSHGDTEIHRLSRLPARSNKNRKSDQPLNIAIMQETSTDFDAPYAVDFKPDSSV